MRRTGTSRTFRFIGLASALTGLLVLGCGSASAQTWWPFATSEPPRPPASIYKAPPAPVPPATAPSGPLPQAGRSSSAPICMQLEQRLVSEGQRGSQGRSQIGRIEEEVRVVERSADQAQLVLQRGDCYETFLFVKSLRQTPACRQAAGQLENAKRRLSELSILRHQAESSSGQSLQDDIIRELARNGCGQQYVQEARKRDGGSVFGLSEDDGPKSENNFGALPYATYRTVCVRLCDGFFFPVSFSTLPNHFDRDAGQCQSRCAAPVELYYHQNPGADIRQAVSVKSQTPYTNLKTAFKYTKEYINGCSCKEAEYVPAAGEKKAETPQPATGSSSVRAASKAP